MRSAFFAVAACGLLGCGHTESHAAVLRNPEPKTTGNVELYLNGQAPPTRPFYEIAIVQAVGYGTEATPEDVSGALIAKAASLGCDAVIRASIDVGYSRAHAAGTCVRFTAPGPAGPPAVLPPAPPKNPSPPNIRPSPSPRVEPLPSAPNQGR